MKTIYLSLFCLLCLKLSAQGYQTETDKAFQFFSTNGDMTKLDTIITQLEQESQKKDNRYLSYWTAYAKYKKALCFLEGSKNNENAIKNGRNSMTEAIKILNKIKNKTSEDYALLSLIKNYSIAYCSPVKVPFISGEAKKLGEMALEMDKKNIRAYLALGIRDYYTPTLYGGGEKFEDCFLKAISLQDTYSSNPYDPSWGKNDAYYYLIKYYLKIKDFEKAAKTLKEGLDNFPDDTRLTRIK